ncbi:hypothetical protein [Jannaschia seohaensis]|uniref:Dimethylpropiothetin dethiomethylase n=1 Tax=Jannaschia seohaensis TaxID=475081 RepID=A0A2Y9AT74_9RHOB|nr:hypothetical protein [Jannaschia seohaensis]PWJ19077.1 dimethylpropiothetin dethiomethylase [Jannaschia seohaensis]SSA45687.1 dimethylpropiothetin dethiomethylase [Jannaschia seohaensis]
MTDTPTLLDAPDWLYLLREFDALYRHGSAGGSTRIRSHRRRVREALSRVIAANPQITPRRAELRPVTAHFPRALDLGERGAMQGMARALREVRGARCEVRGARCEVRGARCEVRGARPPHLGIRI